MTRRFTVDLLHPGQLALTWQEWFIGSQGQRHLALVAMVGLSLLLLLVVIGIAPVYWRLSTDLADIPRLQRDLAASEGDLNLLRANLQALTVEARRQVRWAELLGALSEHIPATLKLQAIEASRAAAPGAPGAPPPPPDAKAEGTLRIESVTPVRPGSAPLVDTAQFMAALMRDPAVNKRFQLKSWEIKPPTGAAAEDDAYLSITITLMERAQ
ncbi:MAG TPA: hypothetical protein VJU81_16465 [Methylomirabilota bacterium]|nr:hypothetical protein [Methylomirabilota bacterium]